MYYTHPSHVFKRDFVGYFFFGGGGVGVWGCGKNVTRADNPDFQHFYNEITRKQCICQVSYF